MRVEDRYPFFRNQRAAILRTGTITALSVDRTRADVAVAGGTLAGVPTLRAAYLVVGSTVDVLLDRDAAVVIGAVGPGLQATWSRLTNNLANGTSIPAGNSATYMIWNAASGSTPLPWNRKSADFSTVECLLAGTYRLSVTQRYSTPGNVTGYAQLFFEGTTTFSQSQPLVSLAGSGWIELHHTQTVVAPLGGTIAVRMGNFGSAAVALQGTNFELQYIGG